MLRSSSLSFAAPSRLSSCPRPIRANSATPRASTHSACTQSVPSSSPQRSDDQDAAAPSGRREMLVAGIVLAAGMAMPGSAEAGFVKDLKKKKLTEEDYAPSEDVGLRVYELEEGKQGPVVQPGDRVVVHFDVIYRGVDVASSRAARLLGGNRTIAEPYEYVVGQPVSAQPVKKISEGAGGLFAGSGGPKPPAALSKATIGMRKGGKRSILVDNSDLGYGAKGLGELPPNKTFELKVEVLDVIPKKA